jgi:hypothetical protein
MLFFASRSIPGPTASRSAASEQCWNDKYAPPCGEPRPASTSLTMA